tara:strand:+ start:736 stop:954 length:219 start_codon:yes stop_codon:yes gene_type:complete
MASKNFSANSFDKIKASIIEKKSGVPIHISECDFRSKMEIADSIILDNRKFPYLSKIILFLSTIISTWIGSI